MSPTIGLSIPSATVMVANVAIGAGVLAFPYAVRCCGVAVGAMVIVFGALILAGSLHILASGSALSGAATYQSVIRTVLPSSRLAALCGGTLEVTVYIYLLGVGAAFCNVVADQLLPLLAPTGIFLAASCQDGSDDPFMEPQCRWPLLTAYACCLQLPLCLVRDLSLFQFTSYLAVGAIAYNMAVVLK